MPDSAAIEAAYPVLSNEQVVHRVLAYKKWIDPDSKMEAFLRKAKRNEETGRREFETSLSVMVTSNSPTCDEIASQGLSWSFGHDSLRVGEIRAIPYNFEQPHLGNLDVSQDGPIHGEIATPHPKSEKLLALKVAEQLAGITIFGDRKICGTPPLTDTNPATSLVLQLLDTPPRVS